MEIPQTVSLPDPQEALALAKDKGNQALKQVVCFTKDKPLASLAIAAGIGLLIGALSRRS